MQLAIMQPYFFPYQGYFQLIAAVDRFVIYDDVSFRKNSWVNRNRILTASGVEYITVPLEGASSSRTIRDTRCAPAKLWRDKMLRMLEQAYARAPERDVCMDLVREGLAAADFGSMRDLALAGIRAVCDYAEISTDIVETSQVYENAELSGPARVLDICRREGASSYVNAPGGRELYAASDFAERGVELAFNTPSLEPYRQPRSEKFVPGLSVIDLVMSVPAAEVRRRLHSGTRSP